MSTNFGDHFAPSLAERSHLSQAADKLPILQSSHALQPRELLQENDSLVYVLVRETKGLTYQGCHYGMMGPVDPESNLALENKQHPDVQDLFDGALRIFEHMLFRNRDQYSTCMNGGCRKCGVHELTLAALQSASIRDCFHPKSSYNTWVKALGANHAKITQYMHAQELVLIVDFIRTMQEGPDMQHHLQGSDNANRDRAIFMEYVWEQVAIWKTHGYIDKMTLEQTDVQKKLELERKEQEDNAWQEILDISKEGKTYTFENMQLAQHMLHMMDQRPADFVSYVMLFNRTSRIRSAVSADEIPNVQRHQLLCPLFPVTDRVASPGEDVKLFYAPEDLQHFVEVIRPIAPGEDFIFATMEDYNVQVPRAKDRSLCRILNSFPNTPVCLEMSKFIRLNEIHIPNYLVQKTGAKFHEQDNSLCLFFISMCLSKMDPDQAFIQPCDDNA